MRAASASTTTEGGRETSMDFFIEGVGESSSPPRTLSGFGNYDVRKDVYSRLVENGHGQEAEFREQLDAHFNRFPPSYLLDVNMDRAEDVLLHQKLLALARDPSKRPVYNIRFLEHISTRMDGQDQQIVSAHSSTRPSSPASNGEAVSSHKRARDCAAEFEPCSKLEDLNLDVRKNSKEATDNYYQRHEEVSVPVHEVIFSAIDKPKLLSQVSLKYVSYLSNIGIIFFKIVRIPIIWCSLEEDDLFKNDEDIYWKLLEPYERRQEKDGNLSGRSTHRGGVQVYTMSGASHGIMLCFLLCLESVFMFIASPRMKDNLTTT
ncbi:serine/threonine-protein kinase STY17-like [Prosopis cineraria]|uniref:serine/threonine-protein kinase STY17-like n=1 Tax=Prosopis cineraria TaxID=364024 RepID=UPI00240FBE46|nr:serine/threonine-protein kinase STY17-like [Prosopis cineraria]